MWLLCAKRVNKIRNNGIVNSSVGQRKPTVDCGTWRGPGGRLHVGGPTRLRLGQLDMGKAFSMRQCLSLHLCSLSGLASYM